jgi:hypothetical protein
MSETGGIDIGMPSEGTGTGPEQLSEEAKQRFAAAAAAMQAIKKEEKKSKKRDDRVARTIIQFLNDDKYTHLFVLISRLVARDCPSIFLLAILSLIHEECRTVTEDYLAEASPEALPGAQTSDTGLVKGGTMDEQTSKELMAWMTRMQMVLSLEAEQILTRLMIDEETIDGTVLQLTTFVLQEFFREKKGNMSAVPFEKMHLLTGNILQTVFEPFMDRIDTKLLGKSDAQKEEEDD